VLCLGYVPAFYSRPMLEEQNWAHRFDLTRMVMTDYWNEEGGRNVSATAMSPPQGEAGLEGAELARGADKQQ
jgi:hypothetical protein